MLKNFANSEVKTIVEYELCFDDGENNGFGFPCDKHGNLFPEMQDAARRNLAYCLKHPEKFKRYNKVVRYTRKFREPAHGTCSCGREVFLYGGYYGATACECGRWYNLFGQELLPPEQWEDDPSESDAWEGYEPNW